MKATVVYESLWGNTAAIAQAIAEGIGPEAQVLSTTQAIGPAIADADLIVAGSPVLGFSLPSDKMRDSIRATPGKAPRPADLSHPPMRFWLEGLPSGHARVAAFETKIRGPFGNATKAIIQGFESAGYRSVAKPQSFIVKGRYGPLRDGEMEHARQWGVELAKAVR